MDGADGLPARGRRPAGWPEAAWATEPLKPERPSCPPIPSMKVVMPFGVVPPAARVERVEALVVVVVPVDLDVHPGVVLGLVEGLQPGGIAVGGAGGVGGHVPVDQLAFLAGVGGQVGFEEIQAGGVDRAVELVDADEVPAAKVIGVVDIRLGAKVQRRRRRRARHPGRRGCRAPGGRCPG